MCALEKGKTKFFAYETKQIDGESFGFEWKIHNFIYLLKNCEEIEKTFFPPNSDDSQYEWYFKVHKNDGVLKHIVFSLNGLQTYRKHLDVSVCLNSYGYIYKFPVKSNVSSLRIASFEIEFTELRKCMNWYTYGVRVDLIISCEVTVSDSIEDFLKENRYLDCDYTDNSSHRNAIMGDKQFCDFRFVIKDETFYVSKVILALESNVFADMFRTKISQDLEPEEILFDIEPDVFETVIYYIYHKKVDQADLKKSVYEILKVAYEYNINSLINVCATFMYKKLSAANALKVLELADIYSINSLKYKSLVIVKHNSELLESEDLENLLLERPHLAVELINIKQESMNFVYTSLGKTKTKCPL